MPLYEYHCKTCEKDFEVLVKLSEIKEFYSCPECGSVHTDKKISAGHFGFRGGSPTGSRPGV